MPVLNKISSLPRQGFRISAAALAIFFCGAIPSYAQQTQIAALTSQTADALEKAHAKKVVVLDFSGPGLEVTQFGRNLADQFSAALAESGSKFVVVDRTQFLQALSAAKPPMVASSDLDPAPVMKLVRADTEVLGHLETDGNNISLAIEVRRFKNGKTIGKFSETLTESNGAEARLAEVLSKVDYPDGSSIGYTEPTCIRCPDPQYPEAAFHARVQGTVVLSVVIETDGRAYDITVQKHLRPDLDSSAVKAVQRYIFKPSMGPNGKPAAVHMTFEIEFHLY
ncbi:MAG TPA: energy transducer TonB [Candidatus Acidoferrales bacterium]|nr:energy transducer TonB [Candidatus Acidoferrales bacterium]